MDGEFNTLTPEYRTKSFAARDAEHMAAAKLGVVQNHAAAKAEDSQADYAAAIANMGNSKSGQAEVLMESSAKVQASVAGIYTNYTDLYGKLEVVNGALDTLDALLKTLAAGGPATATANTAPVLIDNKTKVEHEADKEAKEQAIKDREAKRDADIRDAIANSKFDTMGKIGEDYKTDVEALQAEIAVIQGKIDTFPAPAPAAPAAVLAALNGALKAAGIKGSVFGANCEKLDDAGTKAVVEGHTAQAFALFADWDKLPAKADSVEDWQKVLDVAPVAGTDAIEYYLSQVLVMEAIGHGLYDLAGLA